MNSLFIITTPFQLLGAFEAIYHFNLRNNTLVIIDNNLEKNSHQITDLLNKNRDLFSNIIRHGKGNKSKFLNNIKLIYKLKKEYFPNIFIGDLGSIQKILISNLNTDKIYLLDDGAKTILIHKKFYEETEIYDNSFRQIRFKFFGLKTSSKKFIHLFTFFNLKNIKNHEIIKHNFNYFKKMNKFSEKKLQNKVYILGQPLVENKRVLIHAYENYINKVIESYPNCEIFYLMHRREKRENLNLYTLTKKIHICESNKPGEFFFSELDYIPKSIIGINTTLLFSLSKIFDDLSIKSYRFSTDNILKNKDWFEESTIHFKENNINFIGENID